MCRRALVWHMDTGEVMCTLQGHNRGVKHLSISDKHVATAGHDMSICVWNWRDGSKLATFRGIGQMVNKFTFSFGLIKLLS